MTYKQLVFEQAYLTSLFGYAACLWALIFGVIHVYWAIGGTIGLQGHSMTGVLLLINLAAIPLCLFAAVVAAALMEAWNRIIPHSVWLASAWGACVFLGLRGTVGIAQSILSQDTVRVLLLVYDSWFLLGGVLFGMLSVSYRR